MRYQLRQKLLSWGDDFTIRDDAGNDIFLVDGKVFTIGNQLSIRDAHGVEQASITQIEFVGLSDNRALVILVFNDREVQNRIIQLERYHSADELRRAANFLTERCRGKTLAQVRAEILGEMHETRESMNALMKDDITVADGFGHNHPKKVIRQREEWILAERADGKLAPRLCVERTPGKNSAVKR